MFVYVGRAKRKFRKPFQSKTNKTSTGLANVENTYVSMPRPNAGHERLPVLGNPGSNIEFPDFW